MSLEYVYGKRNKQEIKRKHKLYIVYKIYRLLMDLFTQYDDKKFVTFPKINDVNELNSLYNKLNFYVPVSKQSQIQILVSQDLINTDFEKDISLSSQRNYIKNNNIKLVTHIEKKDQVLLHKIKAFRELSFLQYFKVHLIDDDFYSTSESITLQNFAYLMSEKKYLQELNQISIENFQKMVAKNRDKKNSYCFVTGPSFDKYKEFDYEKNSFKVICNSTVKNHQFLECIGAPNLLVFADPVFHFSPSEYAATFRDEALSVVLKYKCYVMVPQKAMPLIIENYPLLKEYLIGMPVKQKPFNFKINFPTQENFFVNGTANILTLFMIPVASSFSEEVNIIGADGREKNENYFWKHSSSAQFDDLMQTVFTTHPSFFRDRDYEDYYEQHCNYLEKLFAYGENKKIKYFSLTDSFIPALKTRRKSR